MPGVFVSYYKEEKRIEAGMFVQKMSPRVGQRAGGAEGLGEAASLH